MKGPAATPFLRHHPHHLHFRRTVENDSAEDVHNPGVGVQKDKRATRAAVKVEIEEGNPARRKTIGVGVAPGLVITPLVVTAHPIQTKSDTKPGQK